MDVLSIFEGIKYVIEGVSHVQRDALHVHIGLLLFLGFASVFRGEHRFWLALAVVVVICLTGELFDALNRLARDRPIYWLGSAKDVVNTLLWPSVICFGGRWIARLLGLELSLKITERPAEQSPQTIIR